MVAKKRGALVELHRMLREGEVEKVYLAVAKGKVESRTLRQPLHKYVNAKGERRALFTGTWVKRDGRWMVRAFQGTVIP